MRLLFFTCLFITWCQTTPSLLSSALPAENPALTQARDLLRNAPLPKNELAFDRQRNSVRKLSLQKLFYTSNSLPDVRIGICWSGGGSRSALAGTGFLKGLEDINVLGASNYISSLSGGCQGLLAWLVSRLPLYLFGAKLATIQTKGLRVLTHPGRLVKMLGRMINRTIIKPFDPDFDKRTISNLTSLISPSTHPYPFFTAISRFGRKKRDAYHWYTFSPDEVRIYTPGHSTFSMPAQLFGSQFNNGVLVQKKPELSLHRLSTFASSFLSEMVSISIPNPFYKLDGYEYGNKKRSIIRDAGWHYNLPASPLLDPKRDLDLMIIMDAGKTPIEDLEYLLVNFADKYGLAPWTEDLKKKTLDHPIVYIPAGSAQGTNILYVSIAPDKYVTTEDGSVYDPRNFKKNPHCKTTSFTYTQKQAMELMFRMYQTVVRRKGIFLHAIQESMKSRRARKATHGR